jgi:hypothetical protein
VRDEWQAVTAGEINTRQYLAATLGPVTDVIYVGEGFEPAKWDC